MVDEIELRIRIKEALPLGTVFLHAGTHMTVVGHDGSNGYDHSYAAICVEYRDAAGIIRAREYQAHMADVFARSKIND